MTSPPPPPVRKAPGSLYGKVDWKRRKQSRRRIALLVAIVALVVGITLGVAACGGGSVSLGGSSQAKVHLVRVSFDDQSVLCAVAESAWKEGIGVDCNWGSAP